MREFEAGGYSWTIDLARPGIRERVRLAVGSDPVDAVATDKALAAFLLSGLERLADGLLAAVEPQARADRRPADWLPARVGNRELWDGVAALVQAAADAADWSPTVEAVRADFWPVLLRLERAHLAAGRPAQWPFLGPDFKDRVCAVLASARRRWREQREGGHSENVPG